MSSNEAMKQLVTDCRMVRIHFRGNAAQAVTEDLATHFSDELPRHMRKRIGYQYSYSIKVPSIMVESVRQAIVARGCVVMDIVPETSYWELDD